MKAKSLLALTIFSATMTVNAHDTWLVPSQTLLSGKDAWVTVDAAASNEKFVFNHAPLGLDSITVLSPSSKTVEKQNSVEGKLRSVFDVNLTEQGTYQVARNYDMIFARYEENGEKKRWRGTVADVKAGKQPKGLPAEAMKHYAGQLETFVTLDEPTNTVLKPSDNGLDIEYLTHPNELYSGESAEFRVLQNGKPATGLEVKLVRGGVQYRTNLDALKIKTDDEGKFTIKWTQPGMYWLDIESSDDQTVTQDGKRHLGYTAVLEVLPQ